MPLPQLQRLTDNDIAIAFQEIDALPIDAKSKQMLKDIVRAGNNPNSSKLETIIKTLPKARQEQIYKIFAEIAARQKQQADDASKALLALLLLTLGGMVAAYVASPTDEQLQVNQLLNIMKQAYMQGIQDELDYLGCNQKARQPSGAELDHLTQMARDDAASIIATWNKDSAKELARLYEANPNASKQFFIESMRAWADGRIEQKSLFVAFNTETRAREYGRMRFMEENYAETTKFVFKGSPPVCPDCMERFAAGIVDFAYIDEFPCPRHPNCEHRWQSVRKPKVDCQNLWVG